MLSNPLVVVTAVIFALIGMIWGATRTPATRLVVAAFLAVPQFYIPTLPISLADVWLTLMAVTALFDKRVKFVRHRIGLPVLVLALSYTLAMTWSLTGFSQTNILVTYRFLLFGALIFCALAAMAEDRGVIVRAMKWAVPWIVLQAVLAAVFRFSPALEAQFLHSKAADILVGPQAGALWRGVYNNVLDPTKSGGLFVNGNVASMFGGVAFFLLVIVWRMGGSRWFLLWAAASLAGTIATGSKTGILLAIVLPCLYWAIPKLLRGTGRAYIPSVVLLSIPVGVLAPGWVESLFPSFTDSSLNAYESRDVLWSGASQLWADSPWIGLGFGGWEDQIGALTGVYKLPPHNLIIAAWAIGGIVPATCVVGFIAVVVISLMLGAWRSKSADQAKVYAAALCACLWVFVHGMGDNTTIYGHHTTMAFLALAIGCLALAPGKQDDEEVPAREIGQAPIRDLMQARQRH